MSVCSHVSLPALSDTYLCVCISKLCVLLVIARGARRRSALANTCRALTASDKGHVDIEEGVH